MSELGISTLKKLAFNMIVLPCFPVPGLKGALKLLSVSPPGLRSGMDSAPDWGILGGGLEPVVCWLPGLVLLELLLLLSEVLSGSLGELDVFGKIGLLLAIGL